MMILSRDAALRKLQRMAYEIVESNFNEKEIFLAGIKENGSIIARIIADFLKPIFKGDIKLIEIAINKKNPQQVSIVTEKLPQHFDDKVVIIVDDVSNSGQTLLYAIRPFLEYYPAKIQTLVLVDRSHKKFPVSPDFTGLSIATALSERIVVETENGDIAGAIMVAE